MLSVYVVCWIFLQSFQTSFCMQANSVDPDQTAPKGAVWSGSTLLAEKTFKFTSRWQGRLTIVVFGSLRVKIKTEHHDKQVCFYFIRQVHDIFLIFPRKWALTVHTDCLLWRWFAWIVKANFLGKIKKNSDVICWKFYPAYLESKLDLSYFPEKISVGISCGLPARQKIHMKYQVLSSLKNNKKEIKMLSATILLSA